MHEIKWWESQPLHNNLCLLLNWKQKKTHKVFSPCINACTRGLHVSSLHKCLLHTLTMPPPRKWGGALSDDRRLSSVCPMSRTSGLTRKPKGLGRWNLAQGYPRSHATPTPTSRSKGHNSKSRGQLVHRSEMCQYFANG